MAWVCPLCTLENEPADQRCASECGYSRASDNGHDTPAIGTRTDESPRDREIAVLRKKRLWREREDERVSHKKAKTMSNEERSVLRSQIFTSTECFRILSEELGRLVVGNDPHIQADAIDNDIYAWHVDLVPLAGSKLDRAFAYTPHTCVKLHVAFKPDLFPFYPPRVSIVSPKLAGAVGAALEAHTSLQLKRWRPTGSLKDVFQVLLEFVSAVGEVDDARDARLWDAERAVGQLGLAFETVPKAHARLYETETPTYVDSRRVEPQKTGPWKAGTGYGSGSLTDSDAWNAEAAAEAQAVHDTHLAQLVQTITEAVRACGAAASFLFDDDRTCAMTVLERSLKSVSFKEMCDRRTFFTHVLELVQAAAAANARAGQQLHAVTEPAADQAARYLAKCAPVEDDEDRPLATLLAAFVRPPSPEPASDPAFDVNDFLNDFDDNDPGLSPTTVEHALMADAPAEPAVRVDHETLEAAYARALGDARVREAAIAHNHLCADHARQAAPQSAAIRRVLKEACALPTELPVTRSSSIFVRMDAQNSMLWRALITGPDDTPYAGGCFFFDIFFPPNYPAVPPKILLRTTGGGKVRFNPNLYANGKVCLSLLGTWRGAQNEQWNPKASTALQALVSVQSLIFVTDPYFNEPGFESTLGTPEGTAQSDAYNARIQEHTAHLAILDALKHTPPEFDDVVERHFRLKSAAVRENVRRWLGEEHGMRREIDQMLLRYAGL